MNTVARTFAKGTLLAMVVTTSFATGAGAQFRVSVTGFAATPQNTILFQNSEEEATGTWTGFEVALRAGPLSLTAVGMTGTLENSGSNPAQLDRDGGEMSGSVRLFVLPWLGIGGGYALRRYTSAVGVQDWTVPSAGATVQLPLGTPNLMASLTGQLLTGVKVDGSGDPTGLAGEASLTADFARVPLTFKMLYRIERFDFPDGRVEQFERLVVGAGIRIGGW